MPYVVRHDHDNAAPRHPPGRQSLGESDLPKADFYAIEVSRRGAQTYSYDDLSSKNWPVAFTLG